jgi:hypothetical protein
MRALNSVNVRFRVTKSCLVHGNPCIILSAEAINVEFIIGSRKWAGADVTALRHNSRISLKEEFFFELRSLTDNVSEYLLSTSQLSVASLSSLPERGTGVETVGCLQVLSAFNKQYDEN